MKSRCIAQTEELEEEKRLNVMQREELEGEREARRELLARLEHAEERAYRLQNEAELERLRAVAQYTKKWEEREAWWVERFQELERNGSNPTA